MKYASQTDVSPEKSRMEIERTLSRYGATSFAYGQMVDHSVIVFELHGRRVKFMLPTPKMEDVGITEKGYHRNADKIHPALEQLKKQRWRALALAIKAKLEAVESGITLFEDEFLAHIMLPNGATVGQWMKPQIESAYQNGKMPPLLGGPS